MAISATIENRWYAIGSDSVVSDEWPLRQQKNTKVAIAENIASVDRELLISLATCPGLGSRSFWMRCSAQSSRFSLQQSQ